ncbi:hypothetical protein CASFOL_034896 [Castilleja foliolosa]|uniref:Uncharacterized protein n=1 Tax=Castilleja foliolosa TaxID=1961234 RepID=A0ABD3BS20_9LAMI
MAGLKMYPLFIIVLFVLSTEINRVSVEGTALTCCFDNHIDRCIPGLDDQKCDQMCKENCTKGGFCKVFHHEPPNHYCHCYC